MLLSKFIMLLVMGGAISGLAGCCTSNDNVTSDSTTSPTAMVHEENIAFAQEQELLARKVLYFDYDGYALSPEVREIIVAHAKNLLKNPALRLRVTGHTDERGGEKYNIALGKLRAKAVAKALEPNGVSTDRITILSRGKEQPAVTGSDERARSQNRRVELIYEGNNMD